MQLSDRWELAQQRYTGTCYTFARNSVRQIPDCDVDDIVQELLVVLWECCIKYDPHRGASFNTLFQGCAKNKIISLIRRGETKKRKANVTSLDDDAVSAFVDTIVSVEPTEDAALRRMELAAAIETYGVEALHDRRQRKRRPAA